MTILKRRPTLRPEKPDVRGASVWHRIPPENFRRDMLDRHIGEVDGYFTQLFPEQPGPFKASKRMLDSMGRVSLFDLGCGTGNTLRTWKDALEHGAPAGSRVTARGLNRYDYSLESGYSRTRQAIAGKSIEYMLGDGHDMPEVPDRSAEVVLACMSVLHMREPVRALRELDRIAAPGGQIFTNIRGTPHESGAPFARFAAGLEERDYSIQAETVHIWTRSPVSSETNQPRPDFWETTFLRIEKAA